MTVLAALAAPVMDEWRRRYADWDPTPFAQVAATPGAALAAALADAPEAQRIVDAYLRLVAEALHLKYIDRASCARLGVESTLPSTFMGRLLLDAVPRRLPAYPADQRLGLLAKTWNLAEGLHRQPAWMGRIAVALTRDLDDLEHLGEALAATLAPLIGAPRQSTFAGPFTVHVVDLRDVDDDFLPGAMHAAAPSVLCVHDRLRQGLQAAVVLAAGSASRSLGATPCLAEDGEAAAASVVVEVRAGEAAIAGRPVGLATLQSAHAHTAFASGFVAVSAVDSQRLWIVESAA